MRAALLIPVIAISGCMTNPVPHADRAPDTLLALQAAPEAVDERSKSLWASAIGSFPSDDISNLAGCWAGSYTQSFAELFTGNEEDVLIVDWVSVDFDAMRYERRRLAGPSAGYHGKSAYAYTRWRITEILPDGFRCENDGYDGGLVDANGVVTRDQTISSGLATNQRAKLRVVAGVVGDHARSYEILDDYEPDSYPLGLPGVDLWTRVGCE